MNFYSSSYTGSRKKKTVRRVIAVIVSAALIFGATVLFGNYLKKKSENSGVRDFAGIGREDLFPETEAPVIIPPSEGGSGSSDSVKGICLMLGSVTEAQPDDPDDPSTGDVLSDSFNNIEERISAAAENNTGILIPLTGDDGYLLYNSARAAEVSRLPENPSIPNMAGLAEVVASARSKGLRVSAFVAASASIYSADAEYSAAISADVRIAQDAADAGFDELIITSFVNSAEDITEANSTKILKYLNQMTAAAGNCRVGLSLPAKIYSDSTLSPQIELLVSRSVFLAMELNGEGTTAENLDYILKNLAGTLSVYNMRLLLAPENTAVADELTEKLGAAGHENYLFTKVPVQIIPQEPAVPDVTQEPAVSDVPEEPVPDNTAVPDVTE